jgi:hypothetical protein
MPSSRRKQAGVTAREQLAHPKHILQAQSLIVILYHADLFVLSSSLYKYWDALTALPLWSTLACFVDSTALN